MGIYATELAAIRAAIADVLTNGQSSSFNGGSSGQQISAASLETLLKEKRRLEPLAAQELAIESGGKTGRNRILRVSL